jgi:hypothetical protein
MSICLLVNTALCASMCFGSYQPVFDLIDKNYKKQQVEFDNRPSQTLQFIYKFIPIELYPTLCLDSASKSLLKGDDVYLCDITIRQVKPKFNGERITIAVLNYTLSNCPTVKTYKLFFYYYDTAAKVWTEDRKPITIIMQLQNKSDCWYYCTSIDK